MSERFIGITQHFIWIFFQYDFIKIDFKGMEDEKHFGDLTVHIEQNNSSFDFYDKIYDDLEYDLGVPC